MWPFYEEVKKMSDAQIEALIERPVKFADLEEVEGYFVSDTRGAGRFSPPEALIVTDSYDAALKVLSEAHKDKNRSVSLRITKLLRAPDGTLYYKPPTVVNKG